MTKTKISLVVLILPAYLLLQVIMSILAGSISFLVAGAIYSLLIILFTLIQKKEHRYYFFIVVSLFLLLYSVITGIIQFVYIDNVFKDFYLGPDELTFYSCAASLSKLTYGGIWHASFTEFKLSDYSLFAAWISSLQKLSGLGSFYGLLFQKFNVTFLGSFIPGCVFLLCSAISTNGKKAFQAALVYGFLAFTFFYSLGFLRDVHIALIYAIGLYIAMCGKYKLSNYIFMGLLATIAYFIRVENGLFFLSIIGAWIMRSKGRKKIIIGFLSIVALLIVIIKMGGITMIVNTMLQTKLAYDTRTTNLYGNTSSLGIKLMKLPIPLNYIGTTGLSQLVPFPFWSAFKDAKSTLTSILYLPYAIAGLFWFSVWMRFLRSGKTVFKFVKKYKYIVGLCLLYIVLVASTEINARRLMAVYPILFLGYFYISSNRNINKSKELLYDVGIYTVLISAYLVLKF